MFPGRPNAALLVVDVQNGVVARAFERDHVVARVRALVDKARADRAPVIWVQHSSADLPRGSEEWRYVPELVRGDDEPLIHKEYGDSFEGTDLEAVLAERSVGAPPPALVIAHTNLYWGEQRAPGRRAAVVPTAKVGFAAFSR